MGNDLISRSELKKCAIPCQIHNGALTELCVPLYQIDNVQTVERPQGEWLKITARAYKCSVCGRNIHAYDVDLGYYPFCHCGAEMKGGE